MITWRLAAYVVICVFMRCRVPDHASCVLQVTHRLEELEYADSASYMDDGKIQV